MLKKYASRNSPPIPANEHCGETAIGNDGKMYISVANVKGICRWVLVDKSQKTSRKSPKKSKKVTRKTTKKSTKTTVETPVEAPVETPVEPTVEPQADVESSEE